MFTNILRTGLMEQIGNYNQIPAHLAAVNVNYLGSKMSSKREVRFELKYYHVYTLLGMALLTGRL